MKPHPLFEVWKPDEVAECLDGVPDSLYKKLWSFVNDYTGPTPEQAEEPTPGLDCLAGFWRRLKPTEKAILNILAERHENAYNS